MGCVGVSVSTRENDRCKRLRRFCRSNAVAGSKRGFWPPSTEKGIKRVSLPAWKKWDEVQDEAIDPMAKVR